MKQLAGQSVLILGLGASGLAMASWCAAHGAQVTVWDSRAEPPQAEALAQRAPSARRVVGTLEESRLAGVQWLLKSPGLAPGDPAVAPLLQAARAAGVRTGGELDLFVLALQALREDNGYAPKVIAVTGTNGKTTTTALTTLLLQRAGLSARAAGNIGPTLLDSLAEALASQQLPQAWVLELSSFQLHDLNPGAAFEPDAAAVLNLSQDHLDWHGTMPAYAQAKARVFGPRGAMVLNADDPLVAAMEPEAAPTPARRGPRKAATAPIRPVLRFGLSSPKRPGDFGLAVEGGLAWLVRALPAQEPTPPGSADDAELHLQRLMPVDAMRLRGRHNAANALAALALATSVGCPLAPMLHGLREYRGEPHRVELVAEVEGVEAFDDSKGTNVGATLAAITGLGADRDPARLVLILGGEGKGQDFSPLAAAIRRHGRAVALIGRDASAIEQALAGCDAPLQHHGSLEAAVAWCFEQARPGDAVLLSPACASFDMFRGYAHRAEVFVAAVRAHAEARGSVIA